MQRSILFLACGVSAAVAWRGAEQTPIAASLGRADFAQDCKLFPNQRIVLVTVNGDYVSFFKNWYHYAKPYLKSTEQLYVVAEDHRAATELEQLQRDKHFEYTLAKKEAAGSSLMQVPYNSASYGKVVMERPHEILKLLDEGCTVLYSDIDNVWAEDPFVDLAAAGPGNLYVTDDGMKDYWSNYGMGFLDETSTNYCTCFLYIHPQAATKLLMEAWSHGKGHRNQPPFNKELENMDADSGIKTVVLPMQRFPPGDEAEANPGAAIFHANYLVGERAKVEFFEKRGMWSGAPSSEFAPPPPKMKQGLCRWAGIGC